MIITERPLLAMALIFIPIGIFGVGALFIGTDKLLTRWNPEHRMTDWFEGSRWSLRRYPKENTARERFIALCEVWTCAMAPLMPVVFYFYLRAVFGW